ncbi:MAG: phosphoribosylformylglycinamidine synthase [Rhodospirillaceae bacterium TMED8]|mgnify:CR=1 FL=1|nr:phosphoribosylformylglycinamidine synthase [Magnetovibrio sp.]OUT49846.1 MAG: phosphoribosylformylglycinamidine synthase [Rhodospirillaceae bacterium TMED8]|tara:strand:+ start:675 stop:914 length:240 start_codon:yes stop_codon:yes gene_type:complete
MRVKIHVTLKTGVLDPQGKAVQHALGALGFTGITDIRQGKFIEMELSETNDVVAHKTVTNMCEKLLANTVIENYEIEIS